MTNDNNDDVTNDDDDDHVANDDDCDDDDDVTKDDDDEDDYDDVTNDDDDDEWASGSNIHDWCLVDKGVFFGKRESKTVLREPLGTLTTTTGKQCNKNRGMEIANHLLKILANPTLGVSNRCKQYELQYINNQQQYLINRLQKQHLNNQKQRHFYDRHHQHNLNNQKQREQRFGDRRQQQHSSNRNLLQQQHLINIYLHPLRQNLNN